MKAKKVWALILTCVVTLSMVPSTAMAADGSTAQTPVNTAEDDSGSSMDLEDYNGQWEYNETYGCYQLLNVVYCQNPENVEYESLNIYIPAGYVQSFDNGNIVFDDSAVINGYTADTAPVIYCNGASGWSAKTCSQVTLESLSKRNLELDYSDCIKNGFVLVGAASRGSASVNADGNYDGKSPNNITDIKAGLRFIKHNDEYLPGSNARIISAGTSGGGGMSAILGASGNSSDYNEYLEDIGAVMDEDDTVFGDMCYCPISDLDNADMGYAWMYQNPEGLINKGTGEITEFTAFQKALNADLAKAYEEYIRSLDLDGRYSENFDNYARDVAEMFEESYEKYLTVTFGTDTKSAAEDAAKYNWLSYDAATGNVTITGETGRDKLDSIVNSGHNSRSKSIPGFDIFDGSLDARAECHLFGTNFTTIDTGHFSKSLAALLTKNDGKYSSLDGYENHVEEYATALTDEMQQRAKMLNPMYYIQDYMNGENVQPARHFRLLVGSTDSNTTPTVVFNLGKLLEKAGIDVEYDYVWNQGHGTRDYEGEFVDWVNKIVKDAPVETMKDSTVTLANKTVRYTGKAISIDAATVTGSTGEVTYTYYSDSACTKQLDSAPVTAGIYYVTAAVASDENYNAAISNVAELTIEKAAQKITVKTTGKTYKKAKVKKAKRTFNISASTDGEGKLSYEKVGGSKKLTINKKNGNVTVKKGTAKGTYKIKVKITAKSTANYTAKTLTKTIKVIIK